MLDDLTYLHHRDSQDALGQAARQWRQLKFGLDAGASGLLASNLHQERRDNVVVMALGNAANAADTLFTAEPLAVPAQVCRDIKLPAYVSRHSLCVVLAEQAAGFDAYAIALQAAGRGATVIILEQSANNKDNNGLKASWSPADSLLKVTLPGRGLRQFSAGNWMVGLAAILDAAGLVTERGHGLLSRLENSIDWLVGQLEMWQPTVPAAQNPAKQVALELLGKAVILYGGAQTAPIVSHWQAALHQSAKQLAWTGHFPEYVTHELSSWTKQPTSKPFAVVEFHDANDQPAIHQQMVAGAALLSGRRPAAEVVELVGDDSLQRLLYGVAFGDMVAVYVALASGVDPGPQPLHDALIRRMEANHESN